MGLQTTFHAPAGADFLGWRVSRAGVTEIVHEDAASRQVWRVAKGYAEESLVAALAAAVRAPRVVPRLMEELKLRAISAESVIG